MVLSAVCVVAALLLAGGARTRATVHGARGRLRGRPRTSAPRSLTPTPRSHLLPLHAVRWITRFHMRAPGSRRANSADSSDCLQTLAALLDDLARRCASGESMAHAFSVSRTVGAVSPTFDHTTAALQRGATLAEALKNQPTHHGNHGDVALVVHVLRLCATEGGNVSESLDRAAATLRDRHAAAQERVAQSAQARLSAKVLTLVPICFASWTLLTSPDVQRFIFTPAGTVCMFLGLFLNLAGWRVMSRIIRGVQ